MSFSLNGFTDQHDQHNQLNQPNQNPQQILGQLQTILHFQLTKNLTSGNFMVDSIIQMIIMALVTYLITQVKSILDGFGRYSRLFLNKIYYGLKDLKDLILFKQKQITKSIEVPYITEGRQMNELYKAVSWYLSTNDQIDYSKDSDIQYLYENRICPDNQQLIKTNLNISKVMKQNNKKELKFKMHTIKYVFSTELITIYTDKEKKRENQIIRLTVDIDKVSKNDILDEFCQICIIKFLESQMSSIWNQKIFYNTTDKWIDQLSNNKRSLNSIILQNSLKTNICNDVQMFLNSEEWYQERDIPYTRGYLFYGLPGTGKTSMIKALSLHCKRHIHFLMLQNISNDEELMSLLKNINYKETILVIEDIDAMISSVKDRDMLQKEKDEINKNNKNKKNKNKNEDLDKNKNEDLDKPSYKNRDLNNTNNVIDKEKKPSGVTLSGILNALDGIFTNHGRILIMTTNHPEVLDSALIRAGRCDMKFLFDNCTSKQVKELYEMFFNTSLTVEPVLKNGVYSPAHISAIFLRYRNSPNEALNHFDDEEQKIVIRPMIEDNITPIEKKLEEQKIVITPMIEDNITPIEKKLL
jgi:hypothetical protein